MSPIGTNAKTWLFQHVRFAPRTGPGSSTLLVRKSARSGRSPTAYSIASSARTSRDCRKRWTCFERVHSAEAPSKASLHLAIVEAWPSPFRVCPHDLDQCRASGPRRARIRYVHWTSNIAALPLRAPGIAAAEDRCAFPWSPRRALPGLGQERRRWRRRREQDRGAARQ